MRNAIAAAVAARLRSEGFDVEVAADGPSGVALVERARPDLVVLDLMLPGFDGLEVCRRIQKERACPRPHADGQGLRDRPARRPGRRRRRLPHQALQPPGAGGPGPRHSPPGRSVRPMPAAVDPAERTLRLGRVALEPATRRATLDGEPVHLTPTEFDILALLGDKPGVVFTREQLLAEIWGYRDGFGARTVDSHVQALRRKLGRRRHPHRPRRRIRGRRRRALPRCVARGPGCPEKDRP